MLKQKEKEIIEQAESYLAIIMPNFVKDPQRIEGCNYAEKCGKIMYAIVQDGTEWDKFKEYNWRKIYHTWIVTPELIRSVVKEINEDMKFFKGSGGK